MKNFLAAITFSLSLLAGITSAEAATVTLYDGSLNTAPSSQGWNLIPLGGVPTVSVGGGATTLNTTSSDGISAGYFRSNSTLNRTTGYTLSFTVQLLAEDHSNLAAQNNTAVDNIADRAGFSVIVLSSDRRGIELGFWTNDSNTTNRIWAQNDGAVKADPNNAPAGTRFTHAEGTSFLCIAYSHQLVADVGDALSFLQQKYPDGLPSLVSFASGPSRTADIEKTLVTGVHGPREVFCFLVEG